MESHKLKRVHHGTALESRQGYFFYGKVFLDHLLSPIIYPLPPPSHPPLGLSYLYTAGQRQGTFQVMRGEGRLVPLLAVWRGGGSV